MLAAHRRLFDPYPDAVLACRRGPADGDLPPEPVRDGGPFGSGQPVPVEEVRPALSHAGLLGSMARVGACADNAAMESFFALLQKDVLNRKRWATRDELRLAIITWIEATYHRKQRQRGLGRLTPIEYETIINPQVALAALTNESKPSAVPTERVWRQPGSCGRFQKQMRHRCGTSALMLPGSA